MRQANGTIYVGVVAIALAGYFTYQGWFNPNRIVKRQLGELAAALSVPANESDLDRLSRPSRVRSYFADDARVKLGADYSDIDTPERLAVALTAWSPPPEGVNVAFVDVQINVDSSTTARAYLTVEIARPGVAGRQATYDRREAKVGFGKRNGAWLITSAEPNEIPTRP